MTLMEAVVALVILALAGVGCLELAQGASRLEYSATQWNAAVTAAESRMAQLVTGAPASQMSAAGDRTSETLVTRAPWRPGLDVISVSVPTADGKRYVLRKLVPSAVVRSTSAVP